MNGTYIHSASAFIGEANGDIGLLKEEIRRYTQENFRRGNRFILLSLLGARQCIQQHSLEVNTAVYMTTEHGNLAETAAVLDEIYAGHSLPKPFGFINTMSGTAAFYLAQNLGLRGRSIIVSSQDVCFERGLELLNVDFAMGVERSALIGGVDEAPLFSEEGGEIEQRGWRSVDGSGWVYVKSEKEGACGAFLGNRSFRDRPSLIQWMKERNGSSADVVSFGARIGEEEAAALRGELRPGAVFDYLRDYGYSGSATACGISLFIKMFSKRTLLHVNKDPQGKYSLLEVERY
jgi:hypothetical protein